MGQEAMKQKEQDLKEREKEEKRAMINRRLEEKKRSELQMKRIKEINALEEDRKRLNQQDPKQVQLMIPSESKLGTSYTKRGDQNAPANKKQSVPNLLSGANSSFKAQKAGAGPNNLPLNVKGAFNHSSSVMQHPAAQAQAALADENLSANLL